MFKKSDRDYTFLARHSNNDYSQDTCYSISNSTDIDDLKPESLDQTLKRTEEGKISHIFLSEPYTVDSNALKKVIEPLRKSPESVKMIDNYDSGVSEGDFIEILKACAHHE